MHVFAISAAAGDTEDASATLEFASIVFQFRNCIVCILYSVLRLTSTCERDQIFRFHMLYRCNDRLLGS